MTTASSSPSRDSPAPVVIAIDGPAASGKSSVARALAHRLGFAYVNSGEFYRAATWFVLECGADPKDPVAVTAVMEGAHIVSGLHDGTSYIEFEGVYPKAFLAETRINAHVSAVAAVPQVRALLTSALQNFARERDVVMEGRDIGSAVFPQTPYKFYIDASLEVRAQRRAAQADTGQDNLAARDYVDSHRRTSPLVIAEDAHVVDSSRLTIDGVVGEIIGRLKLKKLPAAEALP